VVSEQFYLDLDNAIYPVRVEDIEDRSTLHSTWFPSTSGDPCVIDGVLVELVEVKSSIHAVYLLILILAKVRLETRLFLFREHCHGGSRKGSISVAE
jgi:hypothetical protein